VSAGFSLWAGEDGQAWCDAARQLAAQARIPLDALRIGHLDAATCTTHAAPGAATGRSQATARFSCAWTSSSPGDTPLAAAIPGLRSPTRSARSSPARPALQPPDIAILLRAVSSGPITSAQLQGPGIAR
jgi:2,4-dichlorophenol 6-monooxygenase